MSRHRHLDLKPLDEVRAHTLAAVTPLATSELVSVADALGRITAELVSARESVPHYHGSAMDGIAVRAADLAQASEATPIELELGTPASSARPFSYVETGNALPAWADAVVMIERVIAGPVTVERVADPATPRAPSANDDDCCAASDAQAVVRDSEPGSDGNGRAEQQRSADPARVVHIAAPASPWQHVRLVGEDVVAGEHLLPRGHEIRPYDVGALLAAGVVEVAVRARPVVAILPTGDELIEPGAPRRPGRIVEFNSRMIAALVREWGAEPRSLAPVGDNLDAIRSRLAIAQREADVVCVIAGSSAGDHDFTAAALASVGEVIAHGIAVMPGKPAIVATIAAGRAANRGEARAQLALGIPGYPVSAALICREILEPVLARLLGRAPSNVVVVRATTPRALASRLGQEELIRVTLGKVAGRWIVTPLGRSAGAITTMVRADGLVRLSPRVESVAVGSEVEVELLRPLADVLGTILVAGSHDPVLGLLEDVIRATAPQHKLAISSVGSSAGLGALARGEVHAAASCELPRPAGQRVGLLDGALAADPPVVVHLVARDVGLVVAAGNPLALRSIADLMRDDVRTPPEVRRSAVRFLNRSAGAGADPPAPGEHHAAIEAQELTPLAVAIAVQSGLADAGLGTAAAAAALGLGFVPIAREDFELVLDADFAASVAGEVLRAAARSSAFRDAVAELPGYDASRSGDERRLEKPASAAAATAAHRP